MIGFLKKMRLKKRQKLDAKIKNLEAYIQNFNIGILCEESIKRMGSDEMWAGHRLYIDVNDVVTLIKERHIKPVKINITNAMEFVRIDHEREIPPLTVMPGGKLGVPETIKTLIGKKAQNPIIIVTGEILPDLVLNGNHRIVAAYKKGAQSVEGYVVDIEDCIRGGCLLKECVPVYRAYKKWFRLQEKRAAIKAA